MEFARCKGANLIGKMQEQVEVNESLLDWYQ